MPQIEIAQNLYNHLAACAAKGHNGDINDFLYSHFLPHLPPETNDDRRILELLEARIYKDSKATNRYLLILGVLHKINPGRFATLNNFHLPNSGRIAISTNREKIERNTVSGTVEQVPNSDFWCLAGLNTTQYQDLVFHMMRELHYPFPIAQKVKKSMKDELVFCSADDL